MSKQVDPNEIIKKLTEKNFLAYTCPVCGKRNFSCQPSIATILLSSDIHAIQFGTYLPSAVVVCNSCGHLEFFSLQQLGINIKE